MAEQESKELAVITSNFAVKQYTPQDIQELLVENIGTGGLSQFDLDQIKIPSGGATTWIVPTLDGEEETKTLKAVVVLWKETRSYWEKPMEESGGGTPPDCTSEDMQSGVGNPGGDCMTCPFSAMGSALKGNGQACKQVRHLFILRENAILPTIVNAAPASLGPMKKFFLRMVSQGLPYYGALVNFELEKDRNDQGISYSKIKPSIAQVLTPDERKFFKSYSDSLKPLLGRISNFTPETAAEN